MIGTTLNLKKRGFFKKPTASEIIAVFVLFGYLIGFTIGLVLICGKNKVFLDYIEETFELLYFQKNNESFFKLLILDYLKFLPLIFITYAFGTSIIGCVFIPSVSIFKGTYDGLLISYIYSFAGLSGMGFSALIIIPGNLVYVLLLILSTREAISFSDRILKNALPKGTKLNLFSDFKIYSIRNLIIGAISILGALINTSTTIIFIDYFGNFI